MEENTPFSNVYGTKREDIADMVGEAKAQALAWEYFMKFPHEAKGITLRKSRARMMVETLIGYRAERGNIEVKLANITEVNGEPTPPGTRGDYHFLYRGTEILRWAPSTNTIRETDAKEYEGTASTRNQRKMAREAIDEFRRKVLGL
jgi:hypothetical protein